ncbi:hypothetical protein J7E88_11980 [Streptomyces sp. ISL-10]|uniref:hypothetical protein n=1 Tax=Streptomyces sp. ISL-10 TaxID=2819172 RepID=UPI001BE9F2AD|nr:hypothetical protein [Streptomyces sp. ISL-10]MBT2366006.1 hypothetical protein [Streptomyces sp. ISL-10]
MRIGLLLRDLHHDENALAHHLMVVSERHRADHEVYHLARDLAGWSHQHVRALAEAGPAYGADLDAVAKGEISAVAKMRERASELAGRHGQGELALLRDLRKVCTDATGVLTDWEMLAQGAQALDDQDLLRLAATCRPDTLRQVRWARAMLKEASPQILLA